MAASECRVATNAQGRELAEHGSALFPVACYADDLTAEEVAWHWHDELEVLVMLEGRTAVAAGGRRFELKAGEGAFINSGVLHGMRNAGRGPCRFHSLVFHPRLVGGGVDSIFWQKYLQPLLDDKALECVAFGPETPWQARAMQAIETAWQACAGEAPGYEFDVRAGLSRAVGLLAASRNTAPPPCRKRPAGTGSGSSGCCALSRKITPPPLPPGRLRTARRSASANACAASTAPSALRPSGICGSSGSKRRPGCWPTPRWRSAGSPPCAVFRR